jgi:cell division protein FtsB
MRISISKVIFACLILGGVTYGVTMFRGNHAFSEKHRMIEQLEKENETLSKEIAAKQNYLTRLQQNPDELELEIKRRLMLVNPGSKSFILQDEKKPDSGAPR